ncbi:MAG: NTP transferase domain-containing protein [Deltaproteobacteria bacterium]|nr:NTP transferase domain-containing protein [Deltaproteobacteria bacterium]
MKVLILAAGQGNRLEHLTDEFPKALTKVCGRELIRYQLDFLNHPAITQIGVVCGYQGFHLADFLKKCRPEIVQMDNPDFLMGSILTLQKGISFLDDDFLLMNVDHIYPPKMLDLILKQVGGITAICDFDRKLVADDMKVKLGKDRLLKQIHKGLNDFDGGYIGMTFCPKNKIAIYLNALETTLAAQGPKASVEMILGELAAKGEPISIADTSGNTWLEVDTLDDLQKAEEALRS